MPLIRFHHVEFCYSPGRPVLSDCNFCLEPGQRIALLGANGSGKTTLLHLAVGLLRPAAGGVEAFGRLRRSRADVRQIVAETLERLGLGGYQERITHQLSGGEKRLVALATVLAMQPEVLLLDEPTGGLDDASAQRTVELLTGLSQTMVVVSHDHTFLKSICTGALRLEQGRLEEFDLRQVVVQFRAPFSNF